jgi:hypothetical protein
MCSGGFLSTCFKVTGRLVPASLNPLPVRESVLPNFASLVCSCHPCLFSPLLVEFDSTMDESLLLSASPQLSHA